MTTQEVSAGVYLRVSRDHDGLRAAVDRQEEDCRAECERRGWAVAEVFSDNDASAYSGKARPGYQRLLAAVENGTVGAVVAWHNDRLHRSPSELEGFISLVERTQCRVAIVAGGDYDLTTPDGRLAARIVGAVARKESEDKSRRLRRKHLSLAQEGKPANGIDRLGFGFDSPENAEKVRAAVRHVLSGGSLRSVAQEWGKTPGTVRDILVSARIAGLREHRGALYPAVWPALVERADWEEVRALLGSRTRTPEDLARKYLLSGIAQCGLCGAPLIPRPQKTKRFYVCPPATDPRRSGCGGIRTLSLPVDRIVTDCVHRVLAPLVFSDSVPEAPPEVVAARAELPELEHRLAELEDRFVEGGMDLPLFERLRDRLLLRVEELRAVLVGAVEAAGTAPLREWGTDVAVSWEAWSLDEKRKMVRQATSVIRVHPARRGLNKFDPNRVEVIGADGVVLHPLPEG